MISSSCGARAAAPPAAVSARSASGASRKSMCLPARSAARGSAAPIPLLPGTRTLQPAAGKGTGRLPGHSRPGPLSASSGARAMRVVAQAGDGGSDGSKDLLIVGPGVLGRMVAAEWLAKFPGARVVGQTNSTNSHADLKAMGVEPRVKEDAGPDKFPHVVFCAPPSGSEDYPGEVSAAAALWDTKGGLVFTSSSAVFKEDAGGDVSEDSETWAIGELPRADRLLKCEAVVKGAGGTALRLAGLYTATRGAHTYYLKVPEVEASDDGYLNLIHYEDAASLAVAALLAQERGQERGQALMGCDNTPLTRGEMMAAVVSSGKYEGTPCTFKGAPTGGKSGKKMNNSATRARVGGWEPKYTSWFAFLEQYEP